MEKESMTVYDILGREIRVGDVIAKYVVYNKPRKVGTVTEIFRLPDGRVWLRADRDFKRPFRADNVVNVSALGVQLDRPERPKIYPEDLRRYNVGVRDMLGVLAYTGDKVIWWEGPKKLRIGTLKYFSDMRASVVPDPRMDCFSTSVRSGAFLIYDDVISIPEDILFAPKKKRSESFPPRPKKPSKFASFALALDTLYRERESGALTETELSERVQMLMEDYGVTMPDSAA